MHNLQAGYCWYHYFIKKQNTWPLLLGSWAEIAGNLGAVAQEKMQDKMLYSHRAHWNGASWGLGIAALLDGLNFTNLLDFWKLIPFGVIAALVLADKQQHQKLLEAGELGDDL